MKNVLLLSSYGCPLQGMTMSERRNKLGKSFINYIVSTCDVVADDDDDGGGT